ncbi:hypothetical protein B0H13DRAFT_1995574 [Mycena leptocephala]|nr:hypothetical protein B0H13DRAFT_1995574 [Mycena leptocephala]
MQDTENKIPNARPKRILVIGGGVSGLVTLRNLRERGEFDEVQLVERRDDVGGVWYLDDERNTPNSASLLPPFPSLSETHAYLRAFAVPLLLRGVIRLSTEVCSVEELDGRAGWRVYGAEEIWDAVVIAVACYDHPVFPATPGIPRLRELGLAHHAQTWRGPQDTKASRTGERVHCAEGGEGDVVDAHLADGNVIHDLDGVLFGTGYRPFPDFVRVLDRDTETLVPLVTAKTSPARVPRLHRYTLYAHNPTLAFVGSAFVCYTPFTIADMCSTWLALAWTAERLAVVAAAREEMEAATDGGMTEASALVAYGVLGPFEETFASGLRAEWCKRGQNWDGYVETKRAALELARERERDSLGQ